MSYQQESKDLKKEMSESKRFFYEHREQLREIKEKIRNQEPLEYYEEELWKKAQEISQKSTEDVAWMFAKIAGSAALYTGGMLWGLFTWDSNKVYRTHKWVQGTLWR